VFEDTASFQKLSIHLPTVDQLYENYSQESHFPSLSYGIVANGEPIHHKSFGLSNIESGGRASARTLYRIASMSKSFTAMAILKLRDEGYLNLSDAVAEYIPEMVQAGKPTE
ncbi:MAG: serine hydrolase domain-containing protein, partial [Cyclobacteriaceae bacterium]